MLLSRRTRTVFVDDGWQVDPRPAPPELAEGFEAPRYVDPEPLRTGSDWVSLAEKLDAGGMALLMKYATIGDPIQ
jgi:hypothetical protein